MTSQRILVWTGAEFAPTARRIAGADADIWIVSGPVLAYLPNAPGLLYIYLHPNGAGTAWCDSAHLPVLYAADVAQLNLRDTVVFVGACNGLESQPLLDALWAAGAAAVIAGPGTNYGGIGGLTGADVLAQTLRRALALGLPLAAAWQLARGAVRGAGLIGTPQSADALEYQLLLPPQIEPPRANYGGVVSAILALAATLLALFFGWTAPQGWLPFSPLSPLPLPEDATSWDKTLYVNGISTDTVAALDFALSAVVTDTDVISITDVFEIDPYEDIFGSAETVTYTLVDAWPSSATLATYTYTAGSVITGAQALTWTVATDSAAAELITRTWTLTGGTWTWLPITQTWTISGETAVKTVYLGHAGLCLEPLALALESDYDYISQTNTFTAWVLGTMPLTYTWDFGDGFGDTTSVSTTAHVYTATGTFYPSVVITGCSGLTDTVGTTIMIGAATPTPTNTPTNTPTSTPTETPTPTPYYTPQPWVETPYPTPTLCAGFGCAPTPGATLPYVVYLPIVHHLIDE